MTEHGVRLSALVVAHDEEQQISDCLSCLQFADEIVVVLDRCTDATAEIAIAHGARTLSGSWPLEGDRRNTGIDYCRGEWVLEVDADERVSEALAAEIRKSVAEAAEATHFSIPVDNYIGQRLVRYGWGAYFGVSSVSRLFRRGSKVWGAQRVHPSIAFEGERGPDLANPITHYVDRDITDMIARLNSYTAARARDMRDSGDHGSLPADFRRLFSRFWKCFVGRKGYREGGWGVLIGLMAGLYPLLSTLRARLEDDTGPRP